MKLLIFRLALAALFLTGWALRSAAAESAVRQIDMGVYTVLTNVRSERKVVSWVEKFDLQRRAAQQLIGLGDEQVLPLTVLLVEKDRDFDELLSPTRRPVMGYAPERLWVQSVGLGRQPMIALSLAAGSSDAEAKVRGALAMWLLSSAGVAYDHWVVQGFLHLFGEAAIRGGWITVGQRNEHNVGVLKNYADDFDFNLERASLPPALAWLAVRTLAIRDGKWNGFAGITRYQELAATGMPKERAFAEGTGLSVSAMNAALRREVRDNSYGVVRVTSDVRKQHAAVAAHPATTGLWDLNRARFFVQLSGADRDEALRMIDLAAQELPPDDPGPSEVRWLYALLTQQPGLAAESLTKAIDLGTKNHAMRLQWCMDVINEGIRSSGGIIIPGKQAVRAADLLAGVARVYPESLQAPRLMASLMPSVNPAREADRRLIEKARERHPDDTVLRLGLIAWRWRHGDLTGASEQMEAMKPGPDDTAYVQSYLNWLRAQLDAEERLLAVEDAVSRGEFMEAGAAFNGIQAQNPLMPATMERYRNAKRVIQYYNLTVRARKFIDESQPALAEALVVDLEKVDLPPALRSRVEALRKRLPRPSEP
ncbi:MAG: hypothetical protein H7A44_02570 [Opitutaceae bacterium]|nr:hypothetical protein [Cephaloticoccus sp.]MCP5529300.1 hypothetical protein [Opitutaceae bacterium]